MKVPRHRIPQLTSGTNALVRSGRRVADLVRAAVRKIMLKLHPAGPIAIWNGELRRTSIEHDSVHDEL